MRGVGLERRDRKARCLLILRLHSSQREGRGDYAQWPRTYLTRLAPGTSKVSFLVQDWTGRMTAIGRKAAGRFTAASFSPDHASHEFDFA